MARAGHFVLAALTFGALLVSAGERPEVTWLGLGRPAPLAPGSATLRMAVDASYPPFADLSATGRLVGYEVDLARALAQRLGHPLVLENTDFGNGLDALSAQRFDAVLAGIPFSQDLLVVAYLSEPYFDAGPVLLVRAGSPPTSGRMVLAEVGTPWVDEVTHLARVGSRMEWFWELEDGVQQLANENADALLVDRPTALEQLKRFPWLDMEVPPAIDEDRALYGLRVALGKRNRPLVFATNHALDEMSRDGTLRRIESDWFGASQSAN